MLKQDTHYSAHARVSSPSGFQNDMTSKDRMFWGESCDMMIFQLFPRLHYPIIEQNFDGQSPKRKPHVTANCLQHLGYTGPGI